MLRLKSRGLERIELIISDDHANLGAAKRAVFGSMSWQRCQLHLRQNASAYVPRQSLKMEVASDIRAVLNALDREIAENYLQSAVRKYVKVAPRLSTSMEAIISECLTVFNFPVEHRRTIRTTNAIERINREIRRRTRVLFFFQMRRLVCE